MDHSLPDGAEWKESGITDPVPDTEVRVEDGAVRAEFEAILTADETALGDVWRRTQAGETPDEIRLAHGAGRTGFVWSYLRTARALVDGDLPTAPSVALGVLRTFRRLLKEETLSTAARQVLEERVRKLAAVATNPDARVAEDKEAVKATAQAEENAVPGVYVYALPHYLRYPYDEESGRTLLKVGRADRSVIRRFREQVRTTALPEEPILLRVYPCAEGDSSELERTFHSLLEAADHDRSTARTAGTEWFLTSVKFLDAIAEVLKLPVREVANLADAI